MVTHSALTKLALALPLLTASLSSALPASSDAVAKRQLDSSEQPQLVLAADNTAAASLTPTEPLPWVKWGSNDGAARQTLREPDFVESMLIEAQRKGMDVSQWGVQAEEMEALLDSTVAFTPEDVDNIEFHEQLQEVDVVEFIDAGLSMVETVSSPILKEVEAHEEQSTMQPGSGWIWSACGTHQEAVVLKEVTVTPDPPVPGQNLTVYAKGTVNADIDEGAYADVVVKLGFIRLLSRRFDICELARENDAELKCPLKPGEYELTHTVELPREIPPARFNVHVSGKTQADVDLTCMDVNIDFGKR